MKSFAKYITAVIAAIVLVPVMANAQTSGFDEDDEMLGILDPEYAYGSCMLATTASSSMIGTSWVKQYTYNGTLYNVVITAVTDDGCHVMLMALNATTNEVAFSDVCNSSSAFDDTQINRMLPFWFQFYMSQKD